MRSRLLTPVALVLLSAPALVGARAAERPNIVHIMLDEWGFYEWSGAGHPILQTPNIDRLAAEGMRFTQMLAGGNVCAPTRCTLMLGRHAGHVPRRNNSPRIPLRDDDVTIAEVLKQAGYATGGFGKWSLGDRGTSGAPHLQGFDRFFGYYHQTHAHSYFPNYLVRNGEKVSLPGNTGDFYSGETFSHELIYRESMQFIRENAARPFYAYLCWTVPHGRWGIPDDEPAWLKYRDKDWDAGSERATREAKVYAAMIEMADRQIGELLVLLKELNIDDRTIVLLSGDNGGLPYFKSDERPDGFFRPNVDPRTGVRFRGNKGNFYEGGLRVPFLVRWPGKVEPAAVSDHLGYFPDVLPTLAELAGVEPPADCDGISIVPTLLGEKSAGRAQQQHEFLYWEDARAVAVRLGRWKAIRPLRGGAPGPWQLYDLGSDIEETTDVAARHVDVVARVEAVAAASHEPPRPGEVLDAAQGWKGPEEK